MEVQKELRDTPGVTVLLYDQVCATEKRRRRKRGTLEAAPKRVMINTLVYEGCGDCSKTSNCLSLELLTKQCGCKSKIKHRSDISRVGTAWVCKSRSRGLLYH